MSYELHFICKSRVVIDSRELQVSVYYPNYFLLIITKDLSLMENFIFCKFTFTNDISSTFKVVYKNYFSFRSLFDKKSYILLRLKVFMAKQFFYNKVPV